MKYKDLGDQIDHRDYTSLKFASGVQIFVIGLAKKVLLANNMGMLWDAYKALPPSELTVLGAWLGILGYAFQIFFDFAGYSDMAIGLGRMLGFEFLANFNYPYISQTATEFWRRWHISLGSWFREYVYIPLGGNRVSPPRMAFNILLVWAITGLWHGASWNYLLWGLYFGAILAIERLFLKAWTEKLPAVLRHGYALLIIMISWPIFAIEDMGHMGQYLAAMFGFAGGGLADPAFYYYLSSFALIILISALASTPIGKLAWQKLPPRVQQVAMPVLVLAGILLSTAYLVDGTYNPFLYFRF